MKTTSLKVLALLMIMMLTFSPTVFAAELTVQNAVLSVDGTNTTTLASGDTGTITYTLTVTGKLEGTAAVTYYTQYVIDENGNVTPGAEAVATFEPQPAQGLQTQLVTAAVSIAAGFATDASTVQDLILVKSIVNSNQTGAKLEFENQVQPTLDVAVDPAPPQTPVVDADVTPPVFAFVPADITAEATAVLSPVELDVAAATDNSGAVVVTNDAPAAGFPYGESFVTWTAADPSGNKATAVQKVVIADTTAPAFTFVPADVTVVLAGTRTLVNLGQAQATDIFGASVTNNAPAAGFPVGTSFVTWTAADPHGNAATAVQKVNVKYDFSGILQPINPNGTSIFKLGSTVPVKFQLKDAAGNSVSTAAATISTAKYSNGVLGTELEAVSTSAATTGSWFRYDSTSSQYIFNLATKGLTTGAYQLTVKLDDGNAYKVVISLK